MTKLDDLKLEAKIDAIAEAIFGTAQDPDQIPINKESGNKLDNLSPEWFQCQLDEAGEPMAWAMILPTTQELAKKFVSGKITEAELLNLTSPRESYSALYLCEVVTLPEHRRKGLAFKLFLQGIEKINKTEDYIFCVWPVGEGGLEVSKKVAEHLKRELLIRE
jgi:hypothetical protein